MDEREIKTKKNEKVFKYFQTKKEYRDAYNMNDEVQVSCFIDDSTIFCMCWN